MKAGLWHAVIVRVVVFTAALGLAACSPSAPNEPAARVGTAGTLSATAEALVEATNEVRKRAGVPALRPDERLMHAAQLQAEQMAAAGAMAHTLKGARYPTLESRLAAAGYPWQRAGENLAFGPHTPAVVVDNWMRSPGHRANIVKPEFTELGTGYVVDQNGRPYYVQVFGRPR